MAAAARSLCALLGAALLAPPALLAAPPPAPAAADRQVEPPSVADAVRPYVKTLTRPVYVWHYAMRGRLGVTPAGYIPPDAAELESYLDGRFGRYWDLSLTPHEDATVSGLYVAADPVASRAWGGVGNGWAMVQLVLPRGFRFVDVRPPRVGGQPAGFAPDVVARLTAAGCDAASPAELLTMLESIACRHAAVRTMVDLDVDGILYDWLSRQLAGCPDRPQGAFLLVREEAVDLLQARLFVHETAPPAGPDEAAADRRRVQALFVVAQQAGATRPAIWPDLPAEPAPEELRSWMAEHLFGCGGHAEDALPEAAADAVAQGRAAVARAPADADAHHQLGAALAARGIDGEAAAALEQALRLDPAHVEALAELAWLRATSADPAVRDGGQAVAVAERLVKLSQYRQRFSWAKVTKIRHSMILSAAYATAGNFGRAVDYAHHARELAGLQHRGSATPLTARLLAETERRLALYVAGRPYSPPAPSVVAATR